MGLGVGLALRWWRFVLRRRQEQGSASGEVRAIRLERVRQQRRQMGWLDVPLGPVLVLAGVALTTRGPLARSSAA